MFLIDAHTLNPASLTYVITFPAAFTSLPAAVLPTINNYIDGNPMDIDAEVTAITLSGFTVQLSAMPDTNNYVLNYIASSAGAVSGAGGVNGRKGSELPVFAGAITSSMYMVGVTNEVIPQTVAFTVANLLSVFAGRLAGVPSSPNAAGSALQLTIDGNYLYAHNGTKAGRVGLAFSEWGIPDTAKKVQTQHASLTSGTQTQTIVFPTAYDVADALPDICGVTISNTVDADPIDFISGMVRAVTRFGFTLILNNPPATGNYRVTYEAKV